MLIDSHCHLNFNAFDEDRVEVLARAEEAGIEAIINPAIDLDTSRQIVRLAEEIPRGAKLLLISDFVWLGAAHEIPLANLAERTDLLAVRISDAAERELPDVGLARIQDMNTSEIRWLDSGTATARSAHAMAFASRRAQIDALLSRSGATGRKVLATPAS